jgi:hypothetical protein
MTTDLVGKTGGKTQKSWDQLLSSGSYTFSKIGTNEEAAQDKNRKQLHLHIELANK